MLHLQELGGGSISYGPPCSSSLSLSPPVPFSTPTLSPPSRCCCIGHGAECGVVLNYCVDSTINTSTLVNIVSLFPAWILTLECGAGDTCLVVVVVVPVLVQGKIKTKEVDCDIDCFL